MLGGPYHGKRYALADDSHLFNIVQMKWDYASWHRVNAGDTLIEPVSCPVVRISVGQQYAKAILYPDIQRHTGAKLLEDYVLAAWDAYDITHRGGSSFG